MKYFSLIIIAAATISSCNIGGMRIKGNGNVISKSYSVQNFSDLDLGSSMNIQFTQSNQYSVKVEADENLFKYIEVQVKDNTLEVDTKDHFNLDATGDIKVYVSAPSINSIDVSGAAQFQTVGKLEQETPLALDFSGASGGNILAKAPVIEMDASGASTITIEGETRDIKADASGASTIHAFDLKSENAAVEASGASTVRVFSSIKLDAAAHGASAVNYKGNPQVNSDVSGASSVSKE